MKKTKKRGKFSLIIIRTKNSYFQFGEIMNNNSEENNEKNLKKRKIFSHNN